MVRGSNASVRSSHSRRSHFFNMGCHPPVYNHHCLWDVKPQRISPYCYLNNLLAFCSVISQSLNTQNCRSIATCECNCDKSATELVGHALNFSSTFTLLSWNSTPLNSHLVRSYIRPGETKKTGKKHGIVRRWIIPSWTSSEYLSFNVLTMQQWQNIQRFLQCDYKSTI